MKLFITLLPLLNTSLVFSQTNDFETRVKSALENISNSINPNTPTEGATVGVTYSNKKPRPVEKIDLTGPYEYKTPLETRKLYPSCSGGPYIDPNTETIKGANEQFSFYMQRGNKRKVLFIFGGGGACWDGFTCVGAPSMGFPFYFPDVDTTDLYHYDLQGIVDEKKSNPFHDYTKILIPYCTGDFHLGSRDKKYTYDLFGEEITWTIKHRGFDNFLSVLSFLESKSKGFKFDFQKVKHLTLAGFSEGGQATLFALPYFSHAMPKAEINVISDGATGVISQSFYKTALWNPEDQTSTSWGVEGNLPTWVGIDEEYMNEFISIPNGLMPTTIEKFCNDFQAVKAAIITSHQDQAQIFFYLLMRLTEDPLLTDEQVLDEWYTFMSLGLDSLKDVDNYRSYVAYGSDHGYLLTENFYDSDDIHDVSVSDWVSIMVKGKSRKWENIGMELLA